MHLVEVAFKGNRKEFYLWEGDEAPAAGTSVIVDADRGEDLGQVHATGELAEKRNRGVAHGTRDEPPGGAHADHETTARALKDALCKHVDELRRVKPDKLVRRRREKFLKMGRYVG